MTTFTHWPVAGLLETIYGPFSQHVKEFLLPIHLILSMHAISVCKTIKETFLLVFFPIRVFIQNIPLP